MSKQSFVIGLVTALMLMVGALAGSILYRSSSNAGVFRRISQAVAFNCSTTRVLDSIIRKAIVQGNQDFQNGTYKRLERKGVLTREQVMQAHRNLNYYIDWDITLRNHPDCYLSHH